MFDLGLIIWGTAQIQKILLVKLGRYAESQTNARRKNNEFVISEEQELLVDSVSKMLSSSCNVDELRSQASGEKPSAIKLIKNF